MKIFKNDRRNLVIPLYLVTLLGLTIYSYVLVDPNLTLINHPVWALFREKAVYIGYHRREISWMIYFILLLLLFGFHYYFVKNHKKYNVLKLAFLIAIALLLSYPFLSRDFFNYMFDARILTLYGENPYLHKALDFQQDPWLRFMHWTHRTYPYGPVWLPITLIPSFLSFGKFILNFVFFKSLFAGFYLISVYLLSKIATTSGVSRPVPQSSKSDVGSDSPEVKNNKWAIFFATHPLILIEGLVSSHNDLVAVAFAIVGIYYLTAKISTTSGVAGPVPQSSKSDVGSDSPEVKNNIIARFLLLLSGGIKYITLPLALMKVQNPIHPTKDTRNKTRGVNSFPPRRWNLLATSGMIATIAHLSLFREIQPWYFLNFFALLPFYSRYIARLNIFFAGLLLSYYPYIRLGDWTNIENVTIKHNIIIVFLVLNAVYLLIYRRVDNLRQKLGS